MEAEANFRMIRLARELRELTQTDVEGKGGPPQARLSRIEAGHVQASKEDLHSLGQVLELPTEFFTEPGTPAAAPLFRKRAIRSARRLASIQARLNAAVLVAKRLLDSGVEIDPPNRFPEAGQFAPDEPARAADALRRDWRLPAGRIDDVTSVVESAGGIVLRVDFGTDDASAAFLPMPGDQRLWFLINTREEAGDRVRLSLAHELGHAVLHRMLPSVEEGETEAQAFSFATALLLPAGEFDRLVPKNALTLSDARALKQTFGVSIAAIVRTAYERGRIQRPRYSSLFKQISARQWRLQEPGQVPIEKPEIWPLVLDVHRNEHGYSDDEMAAVARVTPTTLGELFPEEFRRRPTLRAVGVKAV